MGDEKPKTDAKEPADKLSEEETKSREKEVAALELENQTGIHLQKIEQELQRGYKEIEVEDYGKVRIYLPTPGIESELTDYKAKLVGKAIKGGQDYVTKAHVMKFLKETGVWDAETERKLSNLEEDITEYTRKIMITQHANEVDSDTLFELRDKRMKLMEQRQGITSVRDNLFQGTIDAKIEDAILKYQLTLCVKKEDGTCVWKSIEELKNETNKKLLNTVVSKSSYFWQGWSEDLLRSALDNLSV